MMNILKKISLLSAAVLVLAACSYGPGDTVEPGQQPASGLSGENTGDTGDTGETGDTGGTGETGGTAPEAAVLVPGDTFVISGKYSKTVKYEAKLVFSETAPAVNGLRVMSNNRFVAATDDGLRTVNTFPGEADPADVNAWQRFNEGSRIREVSSNNVYYMLAMTDTAILDLAGIPGAAPALYKDLPGGDFISLAANNNTVCSAGGADGRIWFSYGGGSVTAIDDAGGRKAVKALAVRSIGGNKFRITAGTADGISYLTVSYVPHETAPYAEFSDKTAAVTPAVNAIFYDDDPSPQLTFAATDDGIYEKISEDTWNSWALAGVKVGSLYIGDICLAGTGSGFYIMKNDAEPGVWKHCKVGGGDSFNRIRTLVIERDNIYIGTDGGLLVFSIS